MHLVPEKCIYAFLLLQNVYASTKSSAYNDISSDSNYSVPLPNAFANIDFIPSSDMFLPAVAPVPFAPSLFVRTNAPENITLQSFTYSGPGCPAKGGLFPTMGVPKGAGAFSFQTPLFSVGSGPGYEDKYGQRKACMVSWRMGYPKGWRFGVKTVEAKGYVGLEKGEGKVEGTYFFEKSKGHQVSYAILE